MNLITTIQDSIWNQFGASLDMLENAILQCPDVHWNTHSYWYSAYHCIFWTDYYLTEQPNDFQPPKPFTLSEFEPQGNKPDRPYSKNELLDYLNLCRIKAKKFISSLTGEKLHDRWINDYKNFSILEILVYNIRHIQHHSAQLNLILRQTINEAPPWVSQTDTRLHITSKNE